MLNEILAEACSLEYSGMDRPWAGVNPRPGFFGVVEMSVPHDGLGFWGQDMGRWVC